MAMSSCSMVLRVAAGSSPPWAGWQAGRGRAILACMKRRSEQLNIRVTAQERSALEAAARSHGFRGSADYLRAVAFAGKPPTEHAYTVIIHPADPDEGGFWA